jgi:hypothetical protein
MEKYLRCRTCKIYLQKNQIKPSIKGIFAGISTKVCDCMVPVLLSTACTHHTESSVLLDMHAIHLTDVQVWGDRKSGIRASL